MRIRLNNTPKLPLVSATNSGRLVAYPSLPLCNVRVGGDSGMIQFLIGLALFIRSNPAILGDKLDQDVVAIPVMKGGKAMSAAKFELKSVNSPEEVRNHAKGKVELVKIAGARMARH